MATFQILEDDENFAQIKVRNGEKGEVLVKKNHQECRGILQSQNRIEQDTKRLKLSHTEKTVAPVVEIKFVPEQKNNAVVKKEKEDLDRDLLSLDAQNYKIKTKEEISLPLDLYRAEEYQNDIWDYLREMERNNQKIKPNYMDKQTNINWSTRSILVDWLASVADEYKLAEETFHLGINYIDRFLSRISVVREKLQLVGASAMMLAGKVEEIYPIETQEWSYLTGDSFEVRQLLKMEQLILKVLKFGMQQPTAYGFLEHLCCRCNVDEQTKHLAMFLSELVLVEGADYLSHLPSKLAAASLVLARHTLAIKPFWSDEMQEMSGYSLKQLSPVVQRQHKTFRDSPMKKEQSVQTKFKKEKYHRVALIRPKVLTMNELED